MKRIQYTLRGVSKKVDSIAREQAETYQTSLNSLLLDALSKGLGITQSHIENKDMDDLSGKWVEDKSFDDAIECFDKIDEGLWK